VTNDSSKYFKAGHGGDLTMTAEKNSASTKCSLNCNIVCYSILCAFILFILPVCEIALSAYRPTGC